MTDSDNTSLPIEQQVLAAADQCVACGMCLPYCPTYRLAQQEAESPRGRISLISAYYKGMLSADDTLSTHLDHCLLCRSCERVCPAQVPFGRIMDQARASLSGQGRRIPWLKKRLLALVIKRRTVRWLIRFADWFGIKKLSNIVYVQKSRAGPYLRMLGKMRNVSAWDDYYPAGGQKRGDVGLFIGCVQEFFDPTSLQDTIAVLNILGFGVYVPKTQTCCGALHQHAGHGGIVSHLHQQNMDAFSLSGVNTIISLSSACTATLFEQQASCSAAGNAAAYAPDVLDINVFLETIAWSGGRTLQAINDCVYIHYPCTQRNVLKDNNSVKTLLSRIPGLVVETLPDQSCCGAAGSYMLDYPQWSERIKVDLAESLPDSDGYLVSSNIGCILQLREARDKLARLRVVFPVSLVARALGIR